MENNDPYAELEIYLKQINVSKHTIDLTWLDLAAHHERRNFFFHFSSLQSIDRLFLP